MQICCSDEGWHESRRLQSGSHGKTSKGTAMWVLQRIPMRRGTWSDGGPWKEHQGILACSDDYFCDDVVRGAQNV